MSPIKVPESEGRNVAILGVGVLGRRVACAWAAAGYDVIIRDLRDKDLVPAMHFIDTSIDEFKEKLGHQTKTGKYSSTTDLETAVKNAWLVIEAVPEKLPLKTDVMGDLDRLAPHDCIFGTNSSSYKSSFMLEKVDPSRRNRVCNVHYQMPPDLKAVEIMTDGQTDEEILQHLIEHHQKIGLMPIKVRRESTGFIINRIWAAVKRECLMVLAEDVASPSDIDVLFKALFMSKAAPCEMMDSVGLDTVAFIEDNYIKERGLSGALTVEPLRKNYISQGKLGAKSGKGGLYPAGHTTKATGEPDSHHDNLAAPTLYFLDLGMGGNNALSPAIMSSGKIMRGSSDGRPMKELVSDLKTPDGIDIHIPSGRMFWTSMGIPNKNDGVVLSAKLDGSDVTTIVPEGAVHTPKQLVIDQKHEKLYFSDREGLRVMRCNLDGSDHETIVQTGDWHDADVQSDETLWCVGITVDVPGEMFYWTQKGPSKAGKGRIFRASMIMPEGADPASRTDIELVFDNLPEAIDLEFDSDEKTLYWTDRGEYPVGNTLNRAYIGDAKLLGKTTKKDIITRHFHEAIGVKTDKINKHIYVADLGGAVYRMDMDGSNKKRIYDTEQTFTGIALTYIG